MVFLRDSSCRLHCAVLTSLISCRMMLTVKRFYISFSLFSRCMYFYYIKFYLVHLKERRRNSNGIACGQLPRKRRIKPNMRIQKTVITLIRMIFSYSSRLSIKRQRLLSKHILFLFKYTGTYTHLVNFITRLITLCQDKRWQKNGEFIFF